MQDVLQQEARADQDDSQLEPELVGGDAGAEDGGDAEGVGDGEAENDRPQNVLDVRKSQVMLCAEDGEGVLQQLARQANSEEQRNAGKRGDEARRPELGLGGEGHRDGLRRHGASACVSMDCESGELARVRKRGPVRS